MPAPKLPCAQRLCTRFLRAQDGMAAVEFAIVSIPFFIVLFSILELGALFMGSTAIEAATVTAARQIRTGQLQQGASNNAAGFRTQVCNGMSWISSSDCNAKLSVDVRTFDSFADIKVAPPITNGAIDQAQLTFDSGKPCSIVLVRVFYPWTLFTPVLEPGLPNLGPNQRLLSSSVAFRNETWQAGGPTCG